jgi:shikimate 5-dehydrogenase
MLVHQAAHQQLLWTGRSPDVAAMRAAALAELRD